MTLTKRSLTLVDPDNDSFNREERGITPLSNSLTPTFPTVVYMNSMQPLSFTSSWLNYLTQNADIMFPNKKELYFVRASDPFSVWSLVLTIWSAINEFKWQQGSAGWLQCQWEPLSASNTQPAHLKYNLSDHMKPLAGRLEGCGSACSDCGLRTK